ncbi:MAG: hypothetical protein JXA13_04815 [Anaerolineales bacterium]|nr:hypothetical protein [Anaerolineales bacterium]
MQNLFSQRTTPDNLSRVTEALSSLLQRKSQDAFVIIEEKRSGKFVQFAGSASESLLLDLPFQALSEAEVEKARVLFEEFGTSNPQVYDPYTDNSMSSASDTQTSFQVDFGSEIHRAAQACMDIFRRVYGLQPDFKLNIQEN